MRVLLFALSAALLAATPALAQTGPVAPPPAEDAATSGETPQPQSDPAPAANEQNADQEVICRTVQRAESRLRSRRERICGTRAEWEIMQRQAQQDMQRRGSVQTGGDN